jgi:ubiquinone/menaquinone biosynthesis C-methylase UbiE
VNRYVLRGGQEGYDRLRLLAGIRRRDTAELFRLAGVQPCTHCLGPGCGSGEVTFDLAHLTGPVGTVVGIDMNADMLALATLATPAQGVSNVEFQAADVTQWDEPEEATG